ncbi:MAG: AMP-binding protein, partial [Bacteroidota bacterium]
FLKELRKHRFTFITGVNTLFSSLLAQPTFAQLDFSALKLAVAGGVALQDPIAQQWEAVTKTPLIQGYGLTETSPVVACNMCDGTHRIGTIGIPMPSTQVKIVDENNKKVPPGTPGELLVQGPQVMREYWQQPKETAQAFVDGWLKTGDIATMDQDGFLKIIDRKKEMINVSGFNVYPNEIEAVVANHPKVLEVGAVGIPHSTTGKEVITLYVVKRDLTLTAEELLEHCQTYLTKYKVPRHIIFRDSLPKSNVGKILRRALKQEALDTASRTNPMAY